ncbi:MAG: winged helix-turn-helix domain-containing protein [Candidatus Omnitrophica bacterium]|nr:winged helix-turn-helix domain-containing protein [Candidatus Omnitrophota bacterium]MCB9720217.1 winged helix-turn-helix domain-containing protein [Candidatus Omnitrophota bacterium]
MKEQIIDVAGKTYQFLGQNGETEIGALSRGLKEEKDLVLQSLGWLAREDKILFSQRSSKTFVALMEAERDAFSRIAHAITTAAPKPDTKPAPKTAERTVRKAARKTTRKKAK